MSELNINTIQGFFHKPLEDQGNEIKNMASNKDMSDEELATMTMKFNRYNMVLSLETSMAKSIADTWKSITQKIS
ncbi:MAG: EscF/YscF/HrpA family type III secretion system needle major subunit [Gammaproteobacteria bacterium]